MTTRIRQLKTLMKKEALQILRDPSSILIAFVLPLILLFIFGYGLSLDAKHVKAAIVLEDRGPLAELFYQVFVATDYIDAIRFDHRAAAEQAIVDSQVRAVIVVPNDFSRQIAGQRGATVQLLTDGSDTNTATILRNYVLGVVAKWSAHRMRDGQMQTGVLIDVKPRVFFNAELNTRNALVPGSIVLIMSIIGIMLTSLVVAREWERGTMEAMFATPVRKIDMIIGKLLTYYLLGMGSTTVCALIGVFLFGVPFRGSVFALYLTSSVFLCVALIQGYLISTITKNQFLASQASLLIAFLPNFLLSGVLFEISSMPPIIRALTWIFPARYYVTCLQTVFMAGDVWPLLIKNMICMGVIGVVVMAATIVKTPKRLE